MRAVDVMNVLFSWAPGEYPKTCDTLKAGSDNQQVSKVAVCCFATPQVIRQAAEWGAQLLITHEPTYYDHWDNIYRYHDHPHMAEMDMICAGELQALNLPGKLKRAAISAPTISRWTSP